MNVDQLITKLTATAYLASIQSTGLSGEKKEAWMDLRNDLMNAATAVHTLSGMCSDLKRENEELKYKLERAYKQLING